MTINILFNTHCKPISFWRKIFILSQESDLISRGAELPDKENLSVISGGNGEVEVRGCL